MWVPQMFYPAGPPLMGPRLGRAQNFSEDSQEVRGGQCVAMSVKDSSVPHGWAKPGKKLTTGIQAAVDNILGP